MEITYKKIKNLILKIEKDGSLKVSAPIGTPDWRIEHFLREREGWIAAKRELLGRAPRFLDGEEIHLLGRPQRLMVTLDQKESCTWTGEGILLHSREPDDSGYNQKLFYRQFDVFSQRLLREILDDAGGKGVELKLRDMTRRWGTCFVGRNTIQLNRKLVHAPKELIRYVVEHELAHFSQPHHGPGFYDHLARRVPGWKACRQRLNREYGGYL